MAKKKSFLLRIDPEVYDQLQRWADDEFRSVNGQIEFLLRNALKKSGRGNEIKKDESDH
jgi:hypothetical protein